MRINRRALFRRYGGLYIVARLLLGIAQPAEAGRLQFFDDTKTLPGAYHPGIDLSASAMPTISLNGIYRKLGLANIGNGLQWSPARDCGLRLGYKSDIEGRGPFTGIAAGATFTFNGQHFSYAWVPFSQSGTGHYLSWTVRFSRFHSK